MAPTKEKPVIIAILTWNKIDLIKNCIESIFKNTKYPYYRICVFDQASTDGTKEYLDSLGDRIDVIHSPKNIGFVLGNNEVIKKYPMNDVVLLNNDTLVTPGWLTALVECAYTGKDVGIVGAKLVYPDGRLQEAGCEIYCDGRGRNIGKFDDPYKPEYNKLKEVDYCSGSCLYIKREVFDKVGGFDEQYSPCYYEDTDLCFSARKAGFKVIYQPKCVVIHLEGATAGKVISTGAKKYQEINRPKFVKKWKEVLKNHRRSPWEIPSIDGKEKVLIIAQQPPMWDTASGAFRLYQMVKILTKYYNVAFLATEALGKEKYVDDLKQLGVTVFYNDLERMRQLDIQADVLPIDLEAILRDNDFKAIFLEVYNIANIYIDHVRNYSPQSTVIIDSWDVCFVREERKADVLKEPLLKQKVAYNKLKELATYERGDVTLTVTENDRKALLKESPDLDVRIVPNIREIYPKEISWEQRKDLLFVGGFLHYPNVDSILYFCKEVWPIVKSKLPDIKLFIVGNAPPPEVMELQSEDIIITGWVPLTQPYLDSCRVSIAPITYGAGMKGKIDEAMCSGLPVVTTSMGAEGIGIVNGEHALIADTPEDFADAVVRLYKDKELWEKLSQNGKKLIKENYSPEAVEKKLLKILNTLPEPKERHPERFRITVEDGSKLLHSKELTVILIVTDNSEATRLSMKSIFLNSDPQLSEIIVAVREDGEGRRRGDTETKKEKISEELERNFKWYIKYENEQELETVICQIIKCCLSRYVAILDTSIIVSPHWDKRLVAHFKKEGKIGIVILSSTESTYDLMYEFENDAWNQYKKYKGMNTPIQRVNIPCIAVNRSAIKKNRHQDLKELISSIINNGYRAVIAKDTLVWNLTNQKTEDRRQKTKIEFKTPEERLVSVVIPSYNNKEKLLKCLDSFFNQDIDPKEFEIIVVDDGSTDGTIEALQKLKMSKFIPTFKYYTQSHKGQAAATNLGIREASGKFILLTCQDIIAEKDLISQHLSTHHQYSDEDIAVLGYIPYPQSVKKSPFMKFILERNIQFAYDEIEDPTNVKYNYFYAPNVSLKREVFKKVGLFDEDLQYGWQDTEFGFRLALNKYRIVHNSNAIGYHYHQQDLENFVHRQVKAGNGFAQLAYKHPHSKMWSIEEAKGRCVRHLLGKEGFVERAKEFALTLEKIPEDMRSNYKFGSISLLETCYTIILNYYYAKGIYEAICDLEGKNWLKTFTKEKDIQMDKLKNENLAFELLITSSFNGGRGNLDQAIVEAQKASKFAPMSPTPYYFLGTYYLKSGKYALAETALEDGIKRLDIHYPEQILPVESEVSYYLWLSMACVWQSNYRKATDVLESIIAEREPITIAQRAIIYKFLSMCYKAMGEKEKAFKSKQTAERLEKVAQIQNDFMNLLYSK